ncbi:DNA replication factor Cdt1-like isoform X1 [Argonauta hians]
MESKQSTLSDYYHSRKKQTHIKSIQDSTAPTENKLRNSSRCKKYNETKTSIVVLDSYTEQQTSNCESTKVLNPLFKAETPNISNNNENNHQICSPSKRKHSDSFEDTKTPEHNEKLNTKHIKSVRKRLPLFDEKDIEDEPTTLPEEKAKDIESVDDVEKELEYNNFCESIISVPPPISPLPETPHKLRKLREEQAAGSSSVTQSEPDDKQEPVKVPSDKVVTARKKLDLSPEKIKVDLLKCKKVEELKKQLLLIKELKNASKKTSISTKQTPADSTEKPESSVNKVPAYERFQHLTLPVPLTLTLPRSHVVLEEIFQRADDIVRMLHNRSEVCTFTKLKEAVQKSTRRDFKTEVLGQIKTIYPTAFEFKQEKGLPKLGYKSQDYQLTVTPKFDDLGTIHKDPDSGRSVFTASSLIARKKIFHNNLVKSVIKIHKEFLENLPKPMSISTDKLLRWHPKFRLDLVPEVESSPLPQPPYVKVCKTAQDVLNATRGKLPPKLERALINVSEQNSSANKTVTPAPQTKEIKGIPSGLLERIRAKESKRMEEILTQSPLKAQRQAMLKRLLNIYRIMRAYFVTEKKTAILKEAVIEKISEGYTSSISKVDVEKHLNLLLEVAPNCLSLATTHNGKYIKLNRTVNLQEIREKIDLCYKKLTS